MRPCFALIKRNIKLFFKDKGMFFTSLITPAILLVLYATFLGNIYRDSFVSNLPSETTLPNKLINSFVACQLTSSILSVSCVTVAFCANFLMIQDKVNGTSKDFNVCPIKSSTISLSYYIATLISTLIICLSATIICLLYIACVGWYFSLVEVLLLFVDVILLVLFGTALSSFVFYFLSSQGQMSAVGTIVSAGYGFICGAYMPISSFGSGLQKVLSFLPGTYGTSLIRNHCMGGTIRQLENHSVPTDAIISLKDALDCNLYFFSNSVSLITMFLIVFVSCLVLLGGYILLNKFVKTKK